MAEIVKQEETTVSQKPEAKPRPAEKPKLVTLPHIDKKAATPPPRLEPSPALKSRFGLLSRLSWHRIGLLLFIVLPTLLASVYFGLLASDQYVTEIQFSVRGNESEVVDPLQALTGIPGRASPAAADSYVVINYLQSRDIVRDLDQKIDLRRRFSYDHVDFLSRFDTEDPLEYLLDYWRSMVTASYDPVSNIITVSVRAFTPDDAVEIADNIVKNSEVLVNQLSTRAQQDALSGALAEVQRTEANLRALRETIRQFRDREKVADPVQSAGAKQELLARLQNELATLNSEIASTRSFMAADAPSVVVLLARRTALLQEIERIEQQLGGGEKTATASNMLSTYEQLETEREFAQKAYVSALSAAERARYEAGRQQRYLTTFVKPQLPEYPLFPRRLEAILLVMLGGAILWGICVLAYHSVRDHIM
jgi:capsular polysaccharide transport system permease protein